LIKENTVRCSVSKDIGDEVPSLLSGVMVLEFSDVSMVLFVRTIVHSEEAES
jgi:hypothetical protein